MSFNLFGPKTPDRKNLRKELENFSASIENAVRIARGYELKNPEEINHIIIAGVGNSIVAGEILRSYLNLNVPIIVHKGYDLPSFANYKSLVFILSYSGNNEEAISAYKEAKRRRANIFVIAGGGKLKQLTDIDAKFFIMIPDEVSHKLAFPYLFFPMLAVLQNSGIANVGEDVEKMITTLQRTNVEEKAKALADSLIGKIPVIYTSENFKAVGERWKNQLSENAKVMAFTGALPDVRHTGVEGFANPVAEYAIVVLHDQEDHPRIADVIKALKEVVGEKTKVVEVDITGQNKLLRIFSAMHLGDWTSYHLAMTYNVDPSVQIVGSKMEEKLQTGTNSLR